MPGGGSGAGYPPTPSVPRIQTISTPTQPTDLLGFSTESPITSPETAGGVRQQTISLPPSFSLEHEVHSAPPTLNPRFARTGRMDARDVFNSSGTLLSFPSVTDSAASRDWDGDIDVESGKERGRTAKKYPRGADNDDDREESVSLWQRGGRESPPDDDRANAAGIRLVPQSKGNRF